MTDRPKILLADDSVTMRKVAEMAFGDAGMDVSTAVDGQTAMEAFVREQPDIVLADVGLAGTNGYQICEMIKQDEATAHIPVLLMVGAFEPFDQTEAERVCADGFLMKPFSPIRDVVSKVRELLDGDDPSTAASFNVLEDTLEVSSDLDDIDALYESSLDETTRVEEVFLGDMMPPDDIEPDDELIAKETPAANATSPFELMVDDETLGVPTGCDADNAGFFETIDMSATPYPGEKANEAAEVIIERAQTVTAQDKEPFNEPVEDESGPPMPAITDELIDKVVERVLAKLNDSVVREVARDEVPRIAEKLMREALEQEAKG